MHETCRQYVDRRLSEGWKIVGRFGHSVYLSPPDGSFISPVDLRNDVETLRPNAIGDEENIGYEIPDGEPHWSLVDEVDADGLTTYVGSYYPNAWERDLYNIADHSVGSGTIDKIRVYACCQKEASGVSKIKIAIKAGTGSGAPDTVSESSEINLLESWTYHYNSWTINPATGSAFTWDEIDKLQIGVNMYYEGSAYGDCTQVYVQVHYTPPAYKDISTRFRLISPSYKDTATRFKLTVQSFKDISTRAGLWGVTTQAAINVIATQATLKGTIISPDGVNCTIRGFEWGTVDGGPYPNSWTEEGNFPPGQYSHVVSGLEPGQTYYYRSKAAR